MANTAPATKLPRVERASRMKRAVVMSPVAVAGMVGMMSPVAVAGMVGMMSPVAGAGMTMAISP